MNTVTAGSLGTVCMVGSFDTITGKFKAVKDTTIGTVTRKSLLQICKLDKPEDLTQEAIAQYLPQLKAKVTPKVKQNINALYNQLLCISEMPSGCQLFRVSSNLLPMFDHGLFNAIYDQELLTLVDALLKRCKRVIDKFNIRVCTHPDQFNVVNSDTLKTRTQTFRSLYMHKYFMERLTVAEHTSIFLHLNGDTLKRIVNTWGGVPPLFHVSQGREQQGDKKHSDFITDPLVIEQVKQLLKIGSVEVEAKGKTSAVLQLKESVK